MKEDTPAVFGDDLLFTLDSLFLSAPNFRHPDLS